MKKHKLLIGMSLFALSTIALPALSQAGSRVQDIAGATAIYDLAASNGGVAQCNTSSGNWISAQVTDYTYRQFRLNANVGESVVMSRDGWIGSGSVANAGARIAVWRNECGL